jgi:predicted RNA binding protein YcfA (HicA-like mRNA interferase family)
MSQHLPVLSSREVVRAFERAGFVLVPGGKGSHIRMRRASDALKLTIPAHDPVKRGTLRALIRQAGLTVEEFRQLLQ